MDNQTVSEVTVFVVMLIKQKSIERDETLRQSADISDGSKRRKVRYAPVTLSEQNGIRYLHFGTEWIQGAMRLQKPNWLELEYSQKMVAWMLFNRSPRKICQLGLGAGALTKFCYFQFPESENVVVELNPKVISVCRSMFSLPSDDSRLRVLEMDAMDFVEDVANFRLFDVVHCDLYDAAARGPVLDTPEFYAGCKNCLVSEGMMAVNLFGDYPSFRKNLSAIQGVFEEVVCLSPTSGGNVIVLAFCKHPSLDYDDLKARAGIVQDAFGLPAKKWARDLKKALAL